MNLDTAIEAEQSSTETTDATTTTEEESEIPFEPNESTEGYALFSDSSSLVEAISLEVFDNDPIWGQVEWGDTLEDYPDKDTEDLSGQQKLNLLHSLAKGTFGGRQSELNEGYGMGWNTDGEGPPTVYDNDKVDHVPYLDVYSDLPAFDHTTLDESEIEELEANGLDMADFGFDDSIEGPQLPVIDGERVPILYENGDEVVKFLEMMNSIDLEEVTYCPENGELQGTPTLGGNTESTTEKVPESNDSDDEVFNLAANPERVNEVNVSDLRGQGPEELNVSNIDSLRTIQVMLRNEADADNTRKGAISRLKERRNALQGSEDSEEASQDEVEEAVSDSDDSEVTFEEVVQMFDLSGIEKDAVQHRVESGKAGSYEEAAKAVTSV